MSSPEITDPDCANTDLVGQYNRALTHGDFPPTGTERKCEVAGCGLTAILVKGDGLRYPDIRTVDESNVSKFCPRMRPSGILGAVLAQSESLDNPDEM